MRIFELIDRTALVVDGSTVGTYFKGGTCSVNTDNYVCLCEQNNHMIFMFS